MPEDLQRSEALAPSGPDAAEAGDERLAGEASHAAGNLIHRLYYLTDVLEGVPRAEDASEALRQLKDGLGELHVLVARSMALLKRVKVETIEVTAADVAVSVLQRLGCGTDLVDRCGCAEALRSMSVDIDPTHLDRAVRMLAETVDILDADGEPSIASGSIDFELSIAAPFASSKSSTQGMVIRCSVERNGTVARSERNEVVVALAVAVATRLLATFKCETRVDDGETHRTLTIFVPASSRYSSNRTPR